mmetsp:Transcript_119382/g.337750  ORF Transcript_119382/g.337750 Transcript_119382/m.337750 type:complete len:145 (+) Transcript_119382:1703-2137(+)
MGPRLDVCKRGSNVAPKTSTTGTGDALKGDAWRRGDGDGVAEQPPSVGIGDGDAEQPPRVGIGIGVAEQPDDGPQKPSSCRMARASRGDGFEEDRALITRRTGTHGRCVSRSGSVRLWWGNRWAHPRTFALPWLRPENVAGASP